jgi:hypothetical protein
LIAALLYGNIGIKVFYSAVLRDVFKLPPLDHKRGKLLWVAIGRSLSLSIGPPSPSDCKIGVLAMEDFQLISPSL